MESYANIACFFRISINLYYLKNLLIVRHITITFIHEKCVYNYKYLIGWKLFILLELKVIALGNRIFVSSFQMAGIEGIDVQSPKEALSKINSIITKNEAGLVLLSDDIGKDIRLDLAKIRSVKPVPLIFELPSPGSKKEKVDYRALLKQILGV